MRFIFAVIAALVLPALAAPASLARTAEPVASLPYRIDYDGWITIDATINGMGPYDFVIDTGSTLTFVFEKTTDGQVFLPTGREPIRVLGITRAEKLNTYHLGEIGIGGAALESHIGIILPDWQSSRRTPHGVLGLDFLKRYAIHFDARNRIMSLYPHGELPDEMTRGLREVELTPRNFGVTSGSLFTVRGAINRQRTEFIIDLGSATTLINYAAAEMLISGLYVRDSYFGGSTGTRLGDVFGDRTRARVTNLRTLRIDRVNWSNTPIWIYDAPLFEEIGVADTPFGLAGVDLFADRDFALDFGENVMYVARRPIRGR